MKKFARIAVSVLVLALTLIVAVPTQASTLSAAQYMRSLTITNSGAETTNNVVTFDPSTLEMINNGLINSSLTGSAITDLANKDLIYMPKEPVRYKLVQYLESDGTQYIDTGYVPNANTKVVVDIQYTSPPTNWASAMGTQNSNNTFVLAQKDSSGNLRSIIEGRVNGVYTGYQASNVYTNNRLTSILDPSNKFTSFNTTANGSNATTIDYSSLASMWIFSSHGSGQCVSIKFYSSQIYDNGVLVRDFVPAQRTTDDVLGLLDRVNNIFYTNQGTGTFTAGYLAKDYYICDYLQSDGNQYIDTAYVPTNNSSSIVTAMYLSAPNVNTHVLGLWDNSSGTTHRWMNLTLYYSNNNIANTFGNTVISSIPFSTSKYTAELNPKLGYASINSTQTSFTPVTASFTHSLGMFSLHTTASGTHVFTEKSIARIYSLTIFTNYTIQRNFIPVYDTVTQRAIMYDNEFGVEYINLGTGTFDYQLSGNDGTWCLYLPTVAANTSLNERLYISTENLDSKIAYFPGASGLTTNINTSNTITGSDDWNFTIKGQFINGDGSYLFKYGDDLYATMSGNTITAAYGTITVPLSGVLHNTSWAYYYGTTGSGYSFTGDGTITYQSNYIQHTQNNISPNGKRGVRFNSGISSNPYKTMIVKTTATNAKTTVTFGYSTSANNYPSTVSNAISGGLSIRSLPTGSTVYPAVGMYNNYSSTDSIGQRISMIALAKADSPWQYSGMAQYGSSNAAIIANSSTLVNDPYALYVMATKCTGDFMWACVNSSTFTTALASSPYKNIIYASEDWCKALAWNTGSYSVTSTNPVTLTYTQQVPIGYHTYDFRKEGNQVSLYVDSNLVRGGVFNETPWAAVLTSQGTTYSNKVVYDTDAQITFAQGGTTLFTDEITQKKNSTTVGQWTWAQTDNFTFPDASGNGNTGYPSFRETNYGSVDNGANLSVSFGVYQPANVAEYNAPGSEQASTFTGLLPPVEQPTQNVDLGNIKNVPFAEVFEDLLDAGGIPSQLFWLPIMMTLAIAACGVSYHLTRDALISCIAGDVMLGLGCALSLLYTVPLVIGIITTIVLLVKRKTISL